MTWLLTRARLRSGDQLAAKQIDAVQGAALDIEPKNRDPEFLGSHSSRRIHTMASKGQPQTTVSRNNRRCTLDELDLQVPSLVLDPAEIARSMQVADIARSTRSFDCIRGTEVTHPLLADLNGFIVRGSPRSWFRRLTHTTRMHPPSDTRATRVRRLIRPCRVGGPS